MNVSNTYSVTNQTTQANQKVNSGTNNELGKDAFLKILVTQLQNQDPTEPLKDTDFIAQMAQFSSLEQMTNINSAINTLVQLQTSNSVANYADLIGTKVTWLEEVDGELLTQEGLVKAVTMKNGEVVVELEDNTQVPLNSIHRIEKN